MIGDATGTETSGERVAYMIDREVGDTGPSQRCGPCFDYCELVSQADQMPRTLAIAMRTAITKRGVAGVVIPGDVAIRECPVKAATLGISTSASVVRPSDGELQRAANLLNDAKRITILGGAGCAAAHDDLIAVAERLKAPVVHAMRGKEFIEYDNPYDVGMSGLLGFSSGYHAMMNCDALLMLGTDFPYQQFYPKNARIIQVDIRGEQIGRRTKVDLGLVGTVKDTVQALLPLLHEKTDTSYLDKCVDHFKHARQGLADLAVGEPGRTPIHLMTRPLTQSSAKGKPGCAGYGLRRWWESSVLHPGEHWQMLRQDTRYALRVMRQNPGYTAVVVIMLALGVGVNTAIFSVIHGTLFRPLPYAQGDPLVIVRQQAPKAGVAELTFSVPDQ
jgi:pyruvate dehydrogenase (quinone)